MTGNGGRRLVVACCMLPARSMVACCTELAWLALQISQSQRANERSAVRTMVDLDNCWPRSLFGHNANEKCCKSSASPSFELGKQLPISCLRLCDSNKLAPGPGAAATWPGLAAPLSWHCSGVAAMDHSMSVRSNKI